MSGSKIFFIHRNLKRFLLGELCSEAGNDLNQESVLSLLQDCLKQFGYGAKVLQIRLKSITETQRVA